MKNTKKYSTDIVIVGGGISGLYAAKLCLQRGMSVLLLEKTSHLGGRIHTIYHPTYHIEAGAGRFNHNHRLLRGLIREYGLTEVPISTRRGVAARLLKKVIAESARDQSPADLVNITFKEYCRRVLGPERTQVLINGFGYNAEFEVANAAAGIEMMQRDFVDAKFYTCREGLSELVKRMEQDIAPHCIIYRSTHVTNIENKPTYCVVHATDAAGTARRYISKYVMCAIPKADLAALPHLNPQQRDLIDTVAPVSLNRIYGEFPSCPRPWFKGVPRTTTPNKIRQFIPVNPRKGVAMISYSDTKHADYWKAQSDKGVDHLRKEVLKQLQVVFPDVPKIPQPEWIQSYYWPAGVHMWKPGADADAVIPQIQRIMARVFVVGEAYCKVQGWIEGALASVEDVLNQGNIS